MVPQGTNQILDPAIVSTKVGTGQIRKGFLHRASRPLQDERDLAIQGCPTEPPCAEVNSQFVGHVHPGVFTCIFRDDERQIMNAVAAIANQILDEVDPLFAHIGLLGGEDGIEIQGDQDKDNRLEFFRIVRAIGAVDENAAIKAPAAHHQTARERFFDGTRIERFTSAKPSGV